MKRGILIALLVPAVAFAAPKKRKKKKAAPPPEPTQPEPAEAEPAPTPDPPAPTVPPTAGTPGTMTTKGGTSPGSGPVQPPPGTTPGTGPATPPGGAVADKPEPAPAKDVDVDTLRQEYLALRDELFKSRARANAVASQLYSTRVTIKFTWGSARHYGVSKASIRLDGATVYEDSTGAIANDDGVRFSGFVAPGRHLVTFHVEATGKDDDSFTSVTESQIVVKAVANKDLVITAKGRDSGDIAYAWKRGESGSYGLGIDIGVKSVAPAGAKK